MYSIPVNVVVVILLIRHIDIKVIHQLEEVAIISRVGCHACVPVVNSQMTVSVGEPITHFTYILCGAAYLQMRVMMTPHCHIC